MFQPARPKSNYLRLLVRVLVVAVLAAIVAILLRQFDPIYQILKTIKKCPDWTIVSANDTSARQKIMQCLDELSEKDTKYLRKAVEQCVAESSVDHDPPDYDGILYLINRYIFNVPGQPLSLDFPRLSCFWVGREDEWNLTEIWPFVMGPNGQLELECQFHGAEGSPYCTFALEDFDTFNKKYGRRHFENVRSQFGAMHHDIIIDYSQVIAGNPNNSDMYAKRGLAKLHRNDYSGAINDLNQAIQIQPDFAEAYYYRGFAKGYIGQLSGALADFNKVLEIKPGNRFAQDEVVEIKKLIAKYPGQ